MHIGYLTITNKMHSKYSDMTDNRLLYKWTDHEKSPSITTDPNTAQN